MPFKFKIWDQGNDGSTMAIRVKNVKELAKFAGACTQPDLSGKYPNLGAYLSKAAKAKGAPPTPYTRLLHVVWLNSKGYKAPQFFPGRTLVVTYTGPEKTKGGYASQCYCIIDPVGFAALKKHHRQPISVEYVAGASGDALVVLA